MLVTLKGLRAIWDAFLEIFVCSESILIKVTIY